MRVAMRFIGDRPQPEAACLVIAGTFQPPVVKHQHFGMSHFEEKLAIVSVDKRIADNGLGAVSVERRVLEENRIGGLKVVHGNSSRRRCRLQRYRQWLKAQGSQSLTIPRMGLRRVDFKHQLGTLPVAEIQFRYQKRSASEKF